MHGWYENSKIWAQWMKPFQESGWTWKNGERGYKSIQSLEPQWTKNETQNAKATSRVVIAHSLGAHLISKPVLSKATNIIFLSSFGNFIPRIGQSRAIKIGLEGMKKSLEINQEQVMLSNFLKKAYSPNKLTSVQKNYLKENLSIGGKKRLMQDLDLLIKTNGLPVGIPTGAKVLVIESEKDSIVPQQTSNEFLYDLNNYLKENLTHWILPMKGHTLIDPGDLNRRILVWLEQWL